MGHGMRAEQERKKHVKLISGRASSLLFCLRCNKVVIACHDTQHLAERLILIYVQPLDGRLVLAPVIAAGRPPGRLGAPRGRRRRGSRFSLVARVVGGGGRGRVSCGRVRLGLWRVFGRGRVRHGSGGRGHHAQRGTRRPHRGAVAAAGALAWRRSWWWIARGLAGREHDQETAAPLVSQAIKTTDSLFEARGKRIFQFGVAVTGRPDARSGLQVDAVGRGGGGVEWRA